MDKDELAELLWPLPAPVNLSRSKEGVDPEDLISIPRYHQERLGGTLPKGVTPLSSATEQEVEDLAKAMAGRAVEQIGAMRGGPMVDLSWREEEIDPEDLEKLDLFAGEDKSPEVATVVYETHFEAAHRLPHYKGKCIRLHGHSYRVRVMMMGRVHKNGMVVDFGTAEQVVDRLDHRYLNDLMENPTAENTAKWLLERIPLAVKVELWEGLGGGSVIVHV